MWYPKKITEYGQKNNVKIEIFDDGVYTINCWAPKGKRWVASGTHFYSLDGDGYRTKPNWNDTIKDLKRILNMGFEDCLDPECDICNDY